jgi:ring-1,2-phenylacetyl-CoA epoxidase subunit PaaD
VVDRNEVIEVLRTIPDPEMPISIVDLGIVGEIRIERADADSRVAVEIDILPTFVGCPALEMIARSITEKVGGLPGIARTDVRFVYDPPWTVDRISPQGRASLEAHGVTVPESGGTLPVPGHHGGAVELRASAIRCPFCGSDRTTIESMFGPTRCRMIYYCNACRNAFEHMKRV